MKKFTQRVLIVTLILTLIMPYSFAGGNGLKLGHYKDGKNPDAVELQNFLHNEGASEQLREQFRMLVEYGEGDWSKVPFGFVKTGYFNLPPGLMKQFLNEEIPYGIAKKYEHWVRYSKQKRAEGEEPGGPEEPADGITFEDLEALIALAQDYADRLDSDEEDPDHLDIFDPEGTIRLAFDAALDAAYLIDDEDSEEVIEEAYEDLEEALDALKGAIGFNLLRLADKVDEAQELLDDAVQATPDDGPFAEDQAGYYPKAAMDELEDVIEAAELVLEDEDAELKDYDAEYRKVRKAIKDFKLQVLISVGEQSELIDQILVELNAMSAADPDDTDLATLITELDALEGAITQEAFNDMLDRVQAYLPDLYDGIVELFEEKVAYALEQYDAIIASGDYKTNKVNNVLLAEIEKVADVTVGDPSTFVIKDDFSEAFASLTEAIAGLDAALEKVELFKYVEDEQLENVLFFYMDLNETSFDVEDQDDVDALIDRLENRVLVLYADRDTNMEEFYADRIAENPVDITIGDYVSLITVNWYTETEARYNAIVDAE